MNMTDSDTGNGGTRKNGIWNSLNNQTAQTYAGVMTLKAQSLKDPEDKTLDQWICRSNANITALHSVCTIQHKNGKIEIFWKLNHNIHN